MAPRCLAIALALSQTIALFSKENGVVLPALMLSYDLIWSERSTWTRRIISYAVLALPFVAFFVLRSQLHMHLAVPFRENPLIGAPFWTARMTAFQVIGRFLWLFIWPARLSADYLTTPCHCSNGPGRLAGSGALIVLALCVAGIALAVRMRRENKPLCFFVLFFFIALAPTSNLFILIGSVMSERFMYLPAIGLTGCAVGLFYAISRRYSQPALGKALWVAAGVLCLALAARTYARNFDWHDEATLWTSVVKVNPDNALAHLNLGSALLEVPGRVPDAISEYQKRFGFIRTTPRHITISGRFSSSPAAPPKRSRSIGPPYVSTRITPTLTATWEAPCRGFPAV